LVTNIRSLLIIVVSLTCAASSLCIFSFEPQRHEAQKGAQRKGSELWVPSAISNRKASPTAENFVLTQGWEVLKTGF